MTPNFNTQAGWLSRPCRALLGLFGWRVVLVPPPAPKAVVIVYPHTSNWDFIVGGLFRRLGGIPVNRRQSTGFVDGLIEAFARADRLYLAIRAHYADKRGEKPGQEGDIRFR